MQNYILAVLLCLPLLAFASDGSSAKTCRTAITDEEVAIARENIRKYDWARNHLNDLKSKPVYSLWMDAIKSPDQILEVPDEQLWNLMPDTRIHREYYVNQHKGCPVHGIAIKKFSVFHPWKIDPWTKPYKIQCPIGGEWYPSNDFSGGDLTSGEFPDGGNGWKRGEDTFYFLGEYIHLVYLCVVRPAMDRLSQLYVLTGDKRYAHKAAVLMLRVAEQFPNSTDKKDRCYRSSYAALSGLITDYIWSNGDLNGMSRSYDSIYDALDDPELIAFMGAKHPEVKTGADIREYIEKNILRVGAQALMDRAVVGNFGMHQSCSSTLALILDDVEGKNHPSSLELLDWLYDKAAGPLRTFGTNSLHKDGSGPESTGYNSSRMSILPTMENVERLRKRHPDVITTNRYPSLWDEPKVRAMADYFRDMVTLDRYFCSVGDAGGEPQKPGDRSRTLKTAAGGYAIYWYRHYGDDFFAQALMDSNGNVSHPIMYEHPHDDKVREVVKRIGAFPKRTSTLMDGYQLAIARSGSGEDERAMWLFYSASPQHWHHDPMSFCVNAKGMALTPEMGYPKSWDFSRTWEQHILTHNTVMIDRQNPTIHDRGRMLAMQSTPGVELIDAQHDPYRTDVQPFGEPERTYRRTSLMVDLSPEDCYVVDLFRVRGGSEHWQSWHGPAVPPAYEGPVLTGQAKGTLAGEGVEYNTPRPGPDGKPLLDVFAMLDHVERGLASEPFALDYPCGGQRDVHMRITGLPEPDTELITADGKPPSDPSDYTIRFAFACRKGEKDLASQYLTVLEPYAGKRIVDRIERLAPTGKSIPGFKPAGVRIGSGDREDIILCSGIPNGAARIKGEADMKGGTALLRRTGGKPNKLLLSEGTLVASKDCSLTLARPDITGAVTALDRGAKEITVALDIGAPSALVGRRIRVESDLRSAAFTIQAARAAGRGQVIMTLDTTSLLGQGTASGFEDGTIKNEVMLDFASLVNVGGQWRTRYSLYRGATLENEAGTESLRILGVRSDGNSEDVKYDVVLDQSSMRTAVELKSMFIDSDGDGRNTFRLYDYGLGDRVVIPGLASLSERKDGTWTLDATDDVTLTLPCPAGKHLEIRPSGARSWKSLGLASNGSVTASVPLSQSKGKAELRFAD